MCVCVSAFVHAYCMCVYIYMYIWGGVCVPTSRNGTRFGGFGVKQRDAPPLNNGTRLASHYKNRL